MKEESKELYFYTIDRFKEELKKISPSCISPIIAIRQVVKKAIDQYIKEYCEKNCNPLKVFSEKNFQEVCNKIYKEKMKEGK
jgi:hypothetical protein